MLGLGEYGSDDEVEQNVAQVSENVKQATLISGDSSKPNGTTSNAPEDVSQNEPRIGPAPGPQPLSQSEAEEGGSSSVPASPRTTARQLVHNITLPPVPNVVIPPSPPGSPRPSSSAKIARFLELKSQGVHFNDKLSSSSQLRNPSLLDNLMGFAGIDEKYGQYATTLPPTLAPVPSDGFPKWAYGEELAKTQQELSKKKEADKTKGTRDALEFVSANSGVSSRASTPQTGSRPGLKGSAAERVMAGLDREKSRSPQVSSDGSQRNSRFDERHGRRRSRSRSPKRRKDT